MPFKYVNGEFKTCGQFCGWPCVKSYSRSTDNPKSGSWTDLITLMRRKMYGKIIPLKFAPKKFCLQSFGGTMTIEEFRSGNTEGWVHLPYEYHVLQTVETKMTKPKDDSDELILVRNKPLKRESAAIHKMILKK